MKMDDTTSRKRSREEDDGAQGGVAAALQYARGEEALAEAGWTTVEGSMKKRKLNKGQKKKARRAAERAEKAAATPEAEQGVASTKPTLTVSPSHHIQRCLRVKCLQQLVLYCLADGTAPQWVSIRNRAQVRKAVVLMVPGLERAMFTGELRLDGQSTAKSGDAAPMNGAHQLLESNGTDSAQAVAAEEPERSPLPEQRPASSKNPDDFLPVDLDADALPAALKPLAAIFPQWWPVRAPGDDKYSRLHSPKYDMLTAALPQNAEDKKKKSLQTKDASDWVNERTPVATFIATREQLQDNQYVLHPAHFGMDDKEPYLEARRAAKTSKADGWRDALIDDLGACEVPDSEIEDGSVTVGRTVLAVDCEMCIVEGEEYALTRISIVNWDGDIVLDEFVKPDKPITDYLTAPKSLENVTTTLADIQARLLTLCQPRSVLLGHSLESDLKSMKFTHPCIVDTTLLYPHPRGAPLKSSLKFLAQRYLGRAIQRTDGATLGHDSVEDARACLDLVRQKCEKGPRWGRSEAAGEPLFARLRRAPRPGVSAPAGQPREGRSGVIVEHGTPARDFGAIAAATLGCASDAEVAAGARRAVHGDPDGAHIPAGGVDFTFARFRELETARGWTAGRPGAAAGGAAPPRAAGLEGAALEAAVAALIGHVAGIHAALPPCTLFVVYSGNGDPRALLRLQEQQRTFKREYAVRKWDELSVRWTDAEEQALKVACKQAREGLAFMCMT